MSDLSESAKGKGKDGSGEKERGQAKGGKETVLAGQWVVEMERRTRDLKRVVDSTSADGITGMSAERRAKVFCDCLRDGYVLCQ